MLHKRWNGFVGHDDAHSRVNVFHKVYKFYKTLSSKSSMEQAITQTQTPNTETKERQRGDGGTVKRTPRATPIIVNYFTNQLDTLSPLNP